MSQLTRRPLLTWDEFRLRIDLDVLEHWLNTSVLATVEIVRDLRLRAAGAGLEVAAELVLKGFPARVTARLTELRLHRRLFGCRVESLHGPFGIPIPLGLVAPQLERAPKDLLLLDEAERILLVNLAQVIPPGLELHIAGVYSQGRWVELVLAPGALAPPPVPPAEMESA